MLRSFRRSALALASVLIASLSAAQQPGLTLSPFVTFLPTGSATPMAGLSLGISGGPLAIRASGHLSLQERSEASTTDITTRPWGADADAIALLESITYNDHTFFTPYVFTGVSTAIIDSGSLRMNRQGWSYGGGAAAPFGHSLAMFTEVRWRMSRFVLPDAADAPASTREFRIGLSFRVGGSHDVPAITDVLHLISATENAAISGDDPVTRSSASQLLAAADSYLGSPYRRGGTSPSGFDASGFVRFVFSRFGVTLPRFSRDQAHVGQAVRPDWRALAPGDLVMFEDDDGINHVAIYVGRSRIIHSTETGGGVRYDDLESDRGRWFRDHLVAARRVVPNARGSRVDLARGYPSNGEPEHPDHAPRVAMRRRP